MTGVILILVVDWDLFANEWLYISIALYVISLSYCLTIQTRNEHKPGAS